VPSAARQDRDYALLSRRAYGDGGWLDELGRTLGLPAAWLDASRRAHREAAGVRLSLEAWLASPASEPFRHLWIGGTAAGYASIITLTGIRGASGIEALRAAAQGAPPALWVDRVEELSTLLGRHRLGAMLLLGGGTLLVLGALAFRFRGSAWRVMAPTGLAMATVLAAYGWAGRPLNLFTVLALFLVLGIGIDYSIYLQEEQGDRMRAWAAVSLSALTTLLAFGLLAFSRALPLQTFGLTVLLGVGLSWLLAPSFAAAASPDGAASASSGRETPAGDREEAS
jgi:predicted exporter